MAHLRINNNLIELEKKSQCWASKSIEKYIYIKNNLYSIDIF